jgi:hypothetical protein
MSMFATALLGVLALAIVFGFIVFRAEGLTLIAPKRTKAVANAAQGFCSDRCRVDGRCPLTNSAEQAGNCPLWGFVGADVPTVSYGSPFAHLTAA